MSNLKVPEKIITKQDFVDFLHSVRADYTERPDSWENTDIASFLESMAAWTNDMDGFYANQNLQMPENVNWKVFAEIIYASRIYE